MINIYTPHFEFIENKQFRTSNIGNIVKEAFRMHRKRITKYKAFYIYLNMK